jgi:hypothetical protein
MSTDELRWGVPVHPDSVDIEWPDDRNDGESLQEWHERLCAERAEKVVYGGPNGILEGA